MDPVSSVCDEDSIVGETLVDVVLEVIEGDCDIVELLDVEERIPATCPVFPATGF